MRSEGRFAERPPRVIAALHLPPGPGSCHPQALSVAALVDYALEQAGMAVEAGVPALYLQELGDAPWGPRVHPHTVAVLSVVGAALRRAYPELMLGVCTLGPGAREPLATALAMEGQFVRLKVYVGAMVHLEGVVQGCAEEAIAYRARLGADHLAILADVYDRSGRPLAPLPLAQAALQAVAFGRADGLVITGPDLEASLAMLDEVRAAGVDVPVYLGGGATAENVAQALRHAHGVIVGTAFKARGGWTREGIAAPWDRARIQAFMDAVAHAG